MSVGRSTPSLTRIVWSAALTIFCASAVHAAPAPRNAAELDGTWEITGTNGQACRIILRAQQSDKGDYFLGMAPACRHAMPDLAKVGRWSLPDATHLTLREPTGQPVLSLAAANDGFAASNGKRTYALRRIQESGRSAVGAIAAPNVSTSKAAEVTRVAKRPAAAGAPEKPSELVGRYAVMRDKRDTGCMLTLDMARTKGGTRAQLAPGCRDQGIVIFDPSSWLVVKGELVLTARAGHKTHMLKSGEGAWQKDPKDGGKPLGLKRL